jgi:hypothetical protein
LTNDDNEWEIKYDNEGITIEDAVPMIRLSRTKKDKRVFRVIGEPRRKNIIPDRQIVNSLGEGGIMVINSNGNIENGNLIYNPADLQKESPNPLGQYPTDDQIKDVMMKDSTSSALFLDQ